MGRAAVLPSTVLVRPHAAPAISLDATAVWERSKRHAPASYLPPRVRAEAPLGSQNMGPLAGLPPPVDGDLIFRPRRPSPAPLPSGPERTNPVVSHPVGLEPESLLGRLQCPLPATHDVIRRVEISPGVVRLDPRWAPLLSPAMRGPFLDLRLMSADNLRRLSDAALEQLLDEIAGQPQKVRFSRVDSLSHRWRIPWRTRRKGISAVSALALHLYGRGQLDIVNRMLLLRPVNIAYDLHEIVPHLFTLETLSVVLRDMVTNFTKQDIDWTYPEDIQAAAMGNMIEAFFIVHGESKPQVIEAWLVTLLQQLEQVGFDLTTENLGTLTGAVISGALKYVDYVKNKDEKRYYVIDKGAQFVWAAGQFAYIVPALPAILGVAAVASGILLEKKYPIRDLGADVQQLEGKLNVRLLKLKIFQHNEYELDKFLGWITAVKKCNGF